MQWYTNPKINKTKQKKKNLQKSSSLDGWMKEKKKTSKKSTKRKKATLSIHYKRPNWKEGELIKVIEEKIEKACLLTYEEAINFARRKYGDNSIQCKFCGELCKFIKEFNLPKKID